jgi:hypothetical protein
VPKIALPKFWLANILVELFLAHKFGQHWLKNELVFIVGHWQAKKVSNYPNKNQSFGHDQKIGRVCFGSNPNTPHIYPTFAKSHLRNS